MADIKILDLTTATEITETTTIELSIKAADLAYYDDKTQTWKLDKGNFVLHNAASAGDIKSSVKIQIK